MKLEEIIVEEFDAKAMLASMRKRRKDKKGSALTRDLKLLRKKNNPTHSGENELDDMNMKYDGEGDMSDDAITNMKMGG